MTIPAFVNRHGGSAERALEALARHGGFEVQDDAADGLAAALAREVERGTPRLLVAGGDGTVAVAAAALAGSKTELAILPGGTLNHFAKDHGLPEDMDEALRLACSGTARPVDLARVNDRTFINTSSVGAYVLFVEARERLERWMGYRLASLVAAVQVLFRMRRFRVVVQVEGEERHWDTPLVFVGVGERSLDVESRGNRVAGGAPLLHVLVPKPGASRRGLARRYAFATRGTPMEAGSALADGVLVDACRIELVRPHGRVAVDGEIVPMTAPLEYVLLPRALRLVAPPDDSGRM